MGHASSSVSEADSSSLAQSVRTLLELVGQFGKVRM